MALIASGIKKPTTINTLRHSFVTDLLERELTLDIYNLYWVNYPLNLKVTLCFLSEEVVYFIQAILLI